MEDGTAGEEEAEGGGGFQKRAAVVEPEMAGPEVDEVVEDGGGVAFETVAGGVITGDECFHRQ
ncbi:hypothetical protein llg_27110 [Luteolibacter sp. LG18]|nr:hypothetical protein llg_27110 [Luteolibacter sp. LG18]